VAASLTGSRIISATFSTPVYSETVELISERMEFRSVLFPGYGKEIKSSAEKLFIAQGCVKGTEVFNAIKFLCMYSECN
jgi:hypothetical protein